MNRVLLTTGGTGGHIFPALAVAEELRRRNPNIELLFMGSLYGPEQRLAALADVPFCGLAVRGVLGRGTAGLAALGRMALAVPKALAVLHRFKPDAAAGFGSYAAFAPLFAARLLGVPAVLHEQNAVAGASNRLLAKLTGRVCISLPGTTGFEGIRTVFTGNPVRSQMFAVGQKRQPSATRRLLIFGGSQGAHAINEAVIAMLPGLKAAGIELRHQTGVRDLSRVQEAYKQAGFDPACVSAFIDDMAGAYTWADVTMCRSGASTVTELCAAGLPAVLVPFPKAAGDHQTGNARAVEKGGAGLLIPESELSAEKALAAITSLLADQPRRQAMSKAALAMAEPDAAAHVCDELEACVAGKK